MNGAQLVTLTLSKVVEAYGDLTDKHGLPMVMHPLEVADYFKNDPVMFTTALLHDIKNDLGPDKGGKVVEELQKATGIDDNSIAESIDILTKKPGESIESFIDSVIGHNRASLMAIVAADLRVAVLNAEKFGEKDQVDYLKKLGEKLKKAALAGLLKELLEATSEEKPDVKAPKKATAAAPRTLQ